MASFGRTAVCSVNAAYDVGNVLNICKVGNDMSGPIIQGCLFSGVFLERALYIEFDRRKVAKLTAAYQFLLAVDSGH